MLIVTEVDGSRWVEFDELCRSLDMMIIVPEVLGQYDKGYNVAVRHVKDVLNSFAPNDRANVAEDRAAGWRW